MQNNLLDLTKLGLCYRKDYSILLACGYSNVSKNSALVMASSQIRRYVAQGKVVETKKETYHTPHDFLCVNNKSYTSKSIQHQCMSSRILISMMCAGVCVFNKPSLYYLFSVLSKENSIYHLMSSPAYKSCEIISSSDYNDTLSVRELDNLLEKGIFYSDKEVRSFFTRLYAKSESTGYSTRFAGIFINKEKILVIFLQRPGSSKVITYNKKAMLEILESLNPLDLITSAYRELPGFGDKNYYGVRETARSSPYALIISNGNSLIYSSVIGKKGGHVEAGSINDGYDARRLAREKKENDILDNSHQTVLRADLDSPKRVFNRVFVIPFSYEGMGQLNYLLHTSVEGWYENNRSFFSASRRFTCQDKDSPVLDRLFPGKDSSNNNSPSTYLPVCELNILRYLHDKKEDYSIITQESLSEAFAKSCRLDKIKIYSVDLITRQLKEKELTRYAKSGYPAGQDKLIQFLARNNQCYSEQEYRNLPTLFNLSHAEFWNQVDDGKISFKNICSTIHPREITKKCKRKKYRLTINFENNSEHYKMLKKLSSIKGVAMYKILLNCALSELEKQYTTLTQNDNS